MPVPCRLWQENLPADAARILLFDGRRLRQQDFNTLNHKKMTTESQIGNPEPISKEQLDALLGGMMASAEGISDLLFVAGKPPQMEIHGKLKAFEAEPPLSSARIEGLARAIINGNARLNQDLTDRGSCDCSHSLPNKTRFRVNIYRQNGNFAMVLRQLQSKIPTMDALRLPPVFREIIKEKTGLVFVTGGTGSGKTTTLAAMLNEVNLTQEAHIVTLEDPIEFLHPHLKCVFSQRELGRDYFTFPDGLRAALRQAPKVIFVGEIRDRETMEIALTAGETGHVVYSTLHTISAGQTIQRILGMFSKEEEQQVRERLAGTLRYVISQRLAPKIGGGRTLITELMGSNLRTREVIALGESDNRRLSDIIEAGSVGGWHSFEQSLLAAFEQELITDETAMLYCTNKPAMHLRLDRIKKEMETTHIPHSLKMQVEAEHVPVVKPTPPPPPPAMPAATQPVGK
jgi:twitching motility protein PilT